MSEQKSDFVIEACEMCNEFHRVAWYEVEAAEHLLCDRCLSDYECGCIEIPKVSP